MAPPALPAQRMMQLFRERERRGGFLTSWFRPIPGSTGSTGETLVWDVERYDDQVANPVTPGTGVNLNTVDNFSSKEIKPARFSEGIAIDVNDLVERLAGENPFDAANREFTARFIDKANRGLVRMARKLERSVELMASQILQTGQINMTGALPYVKDFYPKATHFPTVGTAWSDAVNCTPIADIESLCNVIQEDSKAEARHVIMGRTALQEFLKADDVRETADVRRFELVEVDPNLKRRGATRYGMLKAGEYDLTMWTYNDKYEPAGGGAKTPYLDDGKVIVLPDDPGFVVGSTRVPRVLPPDPRVRGFVSMPTQSNMGWDLVPNIWSDAPGDVIYAAWYASVVLIPQEIDCFGCITT